MSEKFLIKGKYDIRLCAVILLIVIALIVWLAGGNCSSDGTDHRIDAAGHTDAVAGTWVISDTDCYYFDGNGKGYLSQGEKSYTFGYVLSEDDILSIDFESESVADAQYGYDAGEWELTLSGSDAVIVLKKK